MVRILTCHHFGGQKIGKCDEALQLTVADDFIVLALEHQVSVYNSEFPTDNYTYLGRSGFTTGATRDGGDIGSTPIYFDSGSSATSMSEAGPTDPLQNPSLKQPSPSKSHAPYQSHSKSKSAFSNSSSPSLPPETQIRFSHSFPTVDLIESISYNRRGNYLLCLEKREKIDMSSSSGGGTNSSSNANSYDNTNQGQSQYQGQSHGHGHGHGQGHGHRNQSKNQQSVSRSIRVYFNWDNVTDGSPKPMKARIAGLVSPTGGEPDDDVLCMVEIPGRPITNNLIPSGGSGSCSIPNILAVSSCNILGHLASLTDASTVNIYSYRLKDHGKGRGRTTNSQYADFDFSYCVEILFSLTPQRCRINFLADIIAVSNTNQLTVFRLTKHSRSRTRSISNESGASGGSGSGGTNSSGRKSATVGGGAGSGTAGIFLNFAENQSQSQPTSLKNKIVNAAVNLMGDRDGSVSCDKVVFDPKNESVKVHMNLITRANQKRRFTDTASGIYEEFQEEIGLGNRSRLLHTTSGPALIVEDLLRVYISPDNPNQQQHQHGLGGSIVQVELYALKVKDDLGGVSCVIGTSSQAFVYHLPVRKESSVNVCRVVTYPLTAPLVTFAFDSLFFHALTETGLETYTSRSLYHPIKEFEGFERYKNDCPFQEETPSLVGIRPFMGVRYMAANELLLCLLASPANNWGGSSASTEENQWTIYALQLPNIDLLYDDISKAALQSKITNPETHATLTSELHLILRSYINMNPEMEPSFRKKYQQTCKGMGIEFMKRGSNLIDEIQRLTNEGQLDSNTKYDKELYADDLLDKGVTYLNMSGMDLKSLFEEEPSLFIKDKKMIRGITRFINVMIPSSGIITTTTTTTNNSPYSPNNTNISSSASGSTTLSPKLAAAVTEFLVAHSPESLVTLVINVPILRESNSAKLLQILKKMAETSGYKKQESIALLLTLITISGCDQTTRTQVKEILSKCTNSINSKDINNLRKDKDAFYCNDMDTSFDLLWLLDLKNLNEPKITDLTVCLSAAGSSIPVNVLYQSLMNMEVTIGQLMRAFSQGINLNADLEVQQALTRTLTNILEYFFLDKLKAFNTNVQQSHRFGFKSNTSAFPSLMNNFEAKTTFENNILNNSNTTSPTPKPPPSFHQQLSDDEKHAVKTLVRSYISHVTLKPVTQRTRKNSGGQGSAQAVPGAYITAKTDPPQKAGAGGKKGHEKDKEKSASFAQPHSGHENSHSGRRSSASPEPVTGGTGTGGGGGAQAAGASAAATPGHSQQLQQPSPQKSVPISANKNLWNESKLTFFGKVPNFLIHIIKEMNTNVTATGGGAPQQVLSSASTSSFLLLSTLSTANDETKEYFIKLASLLASPIGNTPGVREIVIKFLETKGQGLPGTTLHTCLQLLVEPAEKAVSTLIAKYPLALMYYAKEMFGRSTSKWKILVSKLKEKIYSNSEDVEMFATIIESVYLYLANTLNPTELEEVLDKEEENTKFFKACRRTELANSYSSMVIQMSNEYLK